MIHPKNEGCISVVTKTRLDEETLHYTKRDNVHPKSSALLSKSTYARESLAWKLKRLNGKVGSFVGGRKSDFIQGYIFFLKKHPTF